MKRKKRKKRKKRQRQIRRIENRAEKSRRRELRVASRGSQRARRSALSRFRTSAERSGVDEAVRAEIDPLEVPSIGMFCDPDGLVSSELVCWSILGQRREHQGIALIDLARCRVPAPGANEEVDVPRWVAEPAADPLDGDPGLLDPETFGCFTDPVYQELWWEIEAAANWDLERPTDLCGCHSCASVEDNPENLEASVAADLRMFHVQSLQPALGVELLELPEAVGIEGQRLWVVSEIAPTLLRVGDIFSIGHASHSCSKAEERDLIVLPPRRMIESWWRLHQGSSRVH